MDALLSLKSVSSSRDISKLRNIYDSVEIYSRNLNTLDVNSTHYGPILISVIMSKLPEEFRLDISRLMPWEIRNYRGGWSKKKKKAVKSPLTHATGTLGTL